MPPVGFEPTISAGEWQQTYALDRVANGTGNSAHLMSFIQNYLMYWLMINLEFGKNIGVGFNLLATEFYI
jgi:hypothetical protein